MPIFDFSTILPYIFTVVVVGGAGCVFAPSLLLLVVITIGIDRRLNPPITGFAAPATSVLNAVEEGSNSATKSPRILHRPSFADMKREIDLVDEQVRLNHKTPADIYPANRQTVKCHRCFVRIRAGEAYSHYNVGTRGFFCRECHQSMGLPLRDDDTGKNPSSAIIGGEGANYEV